MAQSRTRSETLLLQREHPDSTILPQSTKSLAHSRELDVLVDKIHQTPGFEDFLSTPSDAKIQSAASNGPIIVINTSEFRCDAILVESDQTRSIALPRLTVQDIRSNTQQGHTASPRILEWLWDTIAEPVLNALGICEAASEGRLPRIWWIPTGVLSIYPLQAAGRHFKGFGRKHPPHQCFSACGVRHVIGTLWEVSDEISVDIARTVYESVQRGAQADDSICRGLHKATMEQRDKWFTEKSETRSRKRKATSPLEAGSEIDSSRDIITVEDEEDDVSLPQWIHYVHYGV